ncbi:hypothetical protein VTJ04DRAFT_6520 [Mycothermus thermophilus]|uniref:uncharacterized protein n=1 Tax=Humicola insolens TaxID=85995 RepID=UPI003743D90D
MSSMAKNMEEDPSVEERNVQRPGPVFDIAWPRPPIPGSLAAVAGFSPFRFPLQSFLISSVLSACLLYSAGPWSRHSRCQYHKGCEHRFHRRQTTFLFLIFSLLFLLRPSEPATCYGHHLHLGVLATRHPRTNGVIQPSRASLHHRHQV